MIFDVSAENNNFLFFYLRKCRELRIMRPCGNIKGQLQYAA